MCGRFTQHYTWSQVVEFLSVFIAAGSAPNLRPRYNIAPTTTVDVVRASEHGRDFVSMRWGLVPGWWSKTLRELPATINARVETVATKPMFRAAYKSRRCIVPASGFFEWTGPTGDKTPHFFSAADGSPILAFAGLWESWINRETKEEVLSCTILVMDADQFVSIVHDRMPVILTEPEISAWLDGSLTAEQARGAAHVALREWIVDRRMNKSGVGDEDPQTVARAS